MASLIRGGPTTPATTGRSSCAARCRSTSTAATASATTRPPSSSSRSAPRRRWISPFGRPAIRATRSSSTSRRTSPTCRRSCSPVARPSVSRPASRTTSRSIPPPSRRRSRPGPRPSSSATRATRPAPSCRTRSRTIGPYRRPPRPARLQRRDLRPPGLRLLCHRAFSSLPGMRDRTILMGGFSQGLRDDRLAGRLPVRARGRSSRASSRSTSTGSCPHRRSPRTPPWWRSSKASPTSNGCSRSTTAAASSWSTASTRWPADLRAAGRLLRVPANHHLDRPLTGKFAERLLSRSTSRWSRECLRAVGGGPRPRLLRDDLRAAQRGPCAHRAVRRAILPSSSSPPSPFPERVSERVAGAPTRPSLKVGDCSRLLHQGDRRELTRLWRRGRRLLAAALSRVLARLSLDSAKPSARSSTAGEPSAG